jgi:hypothetical protein
MSSGLRTLLALLLLLTVVGCGRAIDRPLRGAAPGTEPPATVGAPPTLQPSEALRFKPLPSPSPAASPGASPSAVAQPPIVRTIAPANGAKLPADAPATISAVLVGRGADLKEASLTINGQDGAPQIDKRTTRDWTIHTTRPLPAGHYTARVLVVDNSGTRGGFTWQFDAGAPEEPPSQ